MKLNALEERTLEILRTHHTADLATFIGAHADDLAPYFLPDLLETLVHFGLIREVDCCQFALRTPLAPDALSRPAKRRVRSAEPVLAA